MELNQKLAEELNDLIKINNDRIAGYEKAANETKDGDADLRSLFNRLASESKQYVSELTAEVGKLGEKPTTNTTVSGKIYRAWMDVKATFSGKDRESVLEACEFGEDAAQKAYRDALASDAEISAPLRQLITNQQSSLKKSHDAIKRLRDLHHEVH